MLLLVLFSILSFGFLFFHVHHLCMPLLGPELVNKILVSCILYLVLYFLAHLSRRLIGELLVYRGIRRPSVVNISNDFFSEAAGSILLIFHI